MIGVALVLRLEAVGVDSRCGRDHLLDHGSGFRGASPGGMIGDHPRHRDLHQASLVRAVARQTTPERNGRHCHESQLPDVSRAVEQPRPAADYDWVDETARYSSTKPRAINSCTRVVLPVTTVPCLPRSSSRRRPRRRRAAQCSRDHCGSVIVLETTCLSTPVETYAATPVSSLVCKRPEAASPRTSPVRGDGVDDCRC